MTADGVPRRAQADSTVSVIIPCFNHGVFLEECLASVHAQTIQPAEIIVVDDGSTDEHTLQVISRIEDGNRCRVIRQANSGPSAARNRAVEASTGDLVLPLDADNWLAPTALAHLKAALLAASDEVRWVYPHQNFVGNRDELAAMPEFNLWLLLTRNFCDTGSLIDRSVFDVGCRYREDIGLGHEDWDFFLSAAEHGFVGVACNQQVLFVRKHGFTRSDLVEHQFGSFTDEIRRLHPRFFAPHNLLRVKQECAPALSVVVGGPAACIRNLLNAQTFQDFELVGERRSEGRFLVPAGTAGRPGGGEVPAQAAAIRLLGEAKGRWVVLWSGEGPAPMADPAFAEKAVVVAKHATSPFAVAMGSGPGGKESFNWRRVGPDQAGTCVGILMEGELLHDMLPELEPASSRTAVEQLLAALVGRYPDLAWRSFPRPDDTPVNRCRDPEPTARHEPDHDKKPREPVIVAPSRPPGDPDLAAVSRTLLREFRHRLAAPFHLGHEPVTRPPRPPRGASGDGWSALLTAAWKRWAPEHTAPLVLSFDPVSFRYMVGTGDGARTRCATVRIPLGRVYTQAFPGTVSLWRRLDLRTGTFDYLLGEPPSRTRCALLGYVSTAHLPGMVGLADAVRSNLERLAFHTGERPVRPFALAGEQVAVYLEGLHPPPGGPEGAPVVPWPTWTLYEVIHPDGRFAYSTHPDAQAIAGGGRSGRSVARVIKPGRTATTVVEAVHETTGARIYVNEPSDASRDGYAVSVVLGSLVTGQFADIVPVIRLVAVTPGPHTAVPEVGHRLASTGWEALVESGSHVAEGMLGDAIPPDHGRFPLYRWRHRERSEWRYSLAGGISGIDGDKWCFSGTVGLVHAPTVDWPTLTDFLELRHPVTGALTYAIGDSAEVRTNSFERVVARLYRSHERCAVPLFRLTGLEGGIAYAVNPEELQAAGYRAEGPVAFVGLAVPPPVAVQPTHAGAGVRRLTIGSGDTAVDGLVREQPAPGLLALLTDPGSGRTSISVAPAAILADPETVVGFASPAPFPWSVPLYELVQRETGRKVITTDGEPALAGTHAVLRVVGYVGSPAHGVDAAAMVNSVYRPSSQPATEVPGSCPPLERVAMRVVYRLPLPVRRPLGAVRRALRRRLC